MLERRPDVRAAERRLAAATAGIGAAEADWFPKFALTSGSMGLDSSSPEHLFDWDSHYFLVSTRRVFDKSKSHAENSLAMQTAGPRHRPVRNFLNLRVA